MVWWTSTKQRSSRWIPYEWFWRWAGLCEWREHRPTDDQQGVDDIEIDKEPWVRLTRPWITLWELQLNISSCQQRLTPFKYRFNSRVDYLCFSSLSCSTFIFSLHLEWSSLDAKRRPYFCLSGLSLALAESWHPSLFVEWGSLETQIFYNNAHTYRVVKSSLRVIRIVIVKWNMNTRDRRKCL